MHPAGTRSATRLLASLLALAAVVLAPVGLAWVARRRFGGAPPWTGIDPPWHWDPTAIREALTNRLTESVIVDVIVRVALAATWVAVGVILVTIVAETIHMVRHGGMTLPSIRGLGWSQRVARFVAAGLTNNEIAKELHVAPRTVRSHLEHAFKKLRVRSRVELAVKVARRDIGQVADGDGADPR